MSQASVHSIDAVRDFRAALCIFGESASAAMSSTTLETQRFVDWINHDQVKYWQSELRRREEQLTEAKSALNRKRMQATFGNPPRDSEEQALLKKAIRRLEEAQDKVTKLAKWRQLVDRAVTEYIGQSQQMTNYLEAELPKAVALFERLIDRLEDYAGVTRPSPGASSPAQASFAQPVAAPPTVAAPEVPAVSPAAPPEAPPATPGDPPTDPPQPTT